MSTLCNGSCQPSKARMTEGLKVTSKKQVRYVKTTLSSFLRSASKPPYAGNVECMRPNRRHVKG